MALIACRECRREVSTEADACPHCGCPISSIGRQSQSWPAGSQDTHAWCYACGSPASRACTRCGQMCCEDHITWWGSPYQSYGAVCSSCARFGWIWVLIGLLIVAIIILVFIYR
jgi:hypothetical protein